MGDSSVSQIQSIRSLVLLGEPSGSPVRAQPGQAPTLADGHCAEARTEPVPCPSPSRRSTWAYWKHSGDRHRLARQAGAQPAHQAGNHRRRDLAMRGASNNDSGNLASRTRSACTSMVSITASPSVRCSIWATSSGWKSCAGRRNALRPQHDRRCHQFHQQAAERRIQRPGQGGHGNQQLYQGNLSVDCRHSEQLVPEPASGRASAHSSASGMASPDKTSRAFPAHRSRSRISTSSAPSTGTVSMQPSTASPIDSSGDFSSSR